MWQPAILEMVSQLKMHFCCSFLRDGMENCSVMMCFLSACLLDLTSVYSAHNVAEVIYNHMFPDWHVHNSESTTLQILFICKKIQMEPKEIAEMDHMK